MFTTLVAVVFLFTSITHAASYTLFNNMSNWNVPRPAHVTASATGVQVQFKAGTFGARNGAHFISRQLAGSQAMRLEYQVFFPSTFNFVQGGKLPGPYGVRGSCTGGDNGTDCFSARLMFRTGGAGELYLYFDKALWTTDVCSRANTVCNFAYGLSFQSPTWIWPRGRWTKLSICIVLNTPGQTDGSVSVVVDAKRVLSQGQLALRKTPRVTADGLMFSTFFGGSNADWATPTDQFIRFRNFKLHDSC